MQLLTILNPKKYLGGEMSVGFVRLFIARIPGRIVGGLLGIFFPIFIYKLFGERIGPVINFFLISYFFYILLLAFGAQFLNKFGFKKAIILSALIESLFYILLVFANEENAFIIIVIAAILITCVRLLFWVPYHVDFAKFTDKDKRGREVSVIFVMVSILGAIGPIVAGYILSVYSFNFLFIISAILLLISAYFYSRIPRTHEKFQWSYKETWRHFIEKKYRNSFYALAANGAENTIAIVIWPIFIFQLLDGNLFEIGVLSTLIVGVTIIIQLSVGKYVDLSKSNKYRTLRTGSIFYSIGWIIKIFVTTGFQIFASGLYHGIAKIFTRTPFQTLIYDMAADQDHFIDEFTVLREMAINIGKVLVLILVSIMLYFFSLQWVFIIAAVSALLLNIIYQDDHEHLRGTHV